MAPKASKMIRAHSAASSVSTGRSVTSPVTAVEAVGVTAGIWCLPLSRSCVFGSHPPTDLWEPQDSLDRNPRKSSTPARPTPPRSGGAGLAGRKRRGGGRRMLLRPGHNVACLGPDAPIVGDEDGPASLVRQLGREGVRHEPRSVGRNNGGVMTGFLEGLVREPAGTASG